MDANRAACPLTQLMDVPGNVQLSCGATRAIGTGGANLVHARPVNRYLGGVSTPANRYQFKFIAETTTIKTSATGQYWVNTAGLNPCAPYEVYVRTSFDNGVHLVTIPFYRSCAAEKSPYAPEAGIEGRMCTPSPQHRRALPVAATRTWLHSRLASKTSPTPAPQPQWRAALELS